jgi:hypothetical protein
LSGTAFIGNDMAMKKKQYKPVARLPESNFTSDSMAAEGAR